MEGTQALIQGLNGLSYGLLLFLLAAGLSLIFGLMGVINLAHGSCYMFGAYLGLTLYHGTGSFILALAGASLISAAAGMGMERFFLRRLYRRELDQVLLTFGFAYIIMDVAKGLWGGTPRSLPTPAVLSGSVHLLGEAFPVYRLFLIAVSLAVALILWLFLDKTRTGMIVRAGVDDREMVGGMGINIQWYFNLIFALGVMLAAFGGVAGGPLIGVYPGLDFEILVLALAVVVVGGLGTLKGAFWGSILIGLLETFGMAFFPNYALFTVYVVMALILIFRPTGLMGRREQP